MLINSRNNCFKEYILKKKDKKKKYNKHNYLKYFYHRLLSIILID